MMAYPLQDPFNVHDRYTIHFPFAISFCCVRLHIMNPSAIQPNLKMALKVYYKNPINQNSTNQLTLIFQINLGFGSPD